MMRIGPYDVIEALTEQEREQALSLRRSAFRAGRADDLDRFDALSRQVLLVDRRDLTAVATYRYRLFAGSGGIGASYAAQHYDLTPLLGLPGPFAEVGRLCLLSGREEPDALRALFGSLVRLVLEQRIALLFGCSSFAGADPARHAGAIAWLRGRCLGPERLRPSAIEATEVPPAAPSAIGVPPLLRAYLGMGAWVGPEVVSDRELDTLHIFTALEVARVPAARASRLKSILTP